MTNLSKTKNFILNSKDTNQASVFLTLRTLNKLLPKIEPPYCSPNSTLFAKRQCLEDLWMLLSLSFRFIRSHLSTLPHLSWPPPPSYIRHKWSIDPLRTTPNSALLVLRRLLPSCQDKQREVKSSSLQKGCRSSLEVNKRINYTK